MVAQAADDPEPQIKGAALQELLGTAQELDAQMRAREAFLTLPAQESERNRSETEHRDENRDEAVATTRESFQSLLDGLEWEGSKLAQDDAFESFASDYVARIDVDGESQLIESSVPLRARGDDGKLAPVDLTLERQPDGSIEPQNAAVPVELPRDLADGIDVGAGTGEITITPGDAPGSTSPATVEGVAALWASTSTDTDFLAAPVPQGGVETFTQLRSPAAPEVSRLRVTSEHGDIALVPSPQGEVFVNRDGARIGRFAPAWAVDAQGTQVKVVTTVQDDTIVLTVKHRDADLAYPIMVDPIFENWYDYGKRWDNGSPDGLRDGTWQYAENPAGWYPHDTRCISGVNCGGTGDGFYIYTYANLGYNPAAGHMADYYYTVHEWNTRSTYIPRVDYWQKNFWWGAGANMLTIDGIFSPTHGNWTGYQLHGQHQDSNNSQYVAVQSGNTINTVPAGAGKQALWGTFPSGTSHPAAASLSLGASIVYLDDQESPSNPAVTHSAPAPTGWVRDYTDRVSFSATDGGLGIRSFLVNAGPISWGSAQPPTNGTGGTCTGLKNKPCATSRSGYYDITSGSLPSGTHNIQVCAFDALTKGACSTSRTVNIDRTGPQINVTGAAWDKRLSDPTDITPITGGGTFGLAVSTTDAASGAAFTEVYLDGQLQAQGGTSVSWNLSTWLLAVGRHTVIVNAVDQLGNLSQKVFHLWVDTDNYDSFAVDPADESAADNSAPDAIDRSCIVPDEDGYCGENPVSDVPDQTPPGDDRSLPLASTQFGLSDDNPLSSFNIYDQPNFQELGVRHVRIIVPWNVATPWVRQADESNEWGKRLKRDWNKLVNAALRTANPIGGQSRQYLLVSFGRCVGFWVDLNGVAQDCKLVPPTLAEYSSAISQFFAQPAMASVNDFTAWNEPNLKGYQPTGDSPELAGRYYRYLAKRCLPADQNCRVAAGDFTDSKMKRASDPTTNGGKYFKLYLKGAGKPARWAWHSYKDGEDAGIAVAGVPASSRNPNHERWKRFASFRAATKTGDIWLTEQGAVMVQSGSVRTNVAYSTAEAEMRAYVTDTDSIQRNSSRIKRFYIYHWRGDAGYDAGLVQRATDPNPNTKRSLYCIFRSAISSTPCTPGT